MDLCLRPVHVYNILIILVHHGCANCSCLLHDCLFAGKSNWLASLMNLLCRYMGTMNGLMGIVNKELVCSAVLVGRIQCIHIVRKSFLERQIAQSSWSIRYCVSSAGNGQDTHMICWRKIAITSVMYSVTGLVFQRSQVMPLFLGPVCVFVFWFSRFMWLLGFCLLTGWVNRFAHAGDTALEVAGNTAMRVSLPSFRFVHAASSLYLNATLWMFKSYELEFCR